MNIVSYWKSCMTTNFANFNGRARRAELWGFFLMNIAISIALGILSSIFGELGALIIFGASILYSLIAFIPGIALGVRRLHDTGRSGLWYLIAFIPFIGIIWFFVLAYCLDSTPGCNKYGENPKGM